MFDAFTHSVTAVTSLPVGIMTFRQPLVITGQGEQQEPANYGLRTLLDYFFCIETGANSFRVVFFRDKSVSVVFEAAKEAAALCLYSAQNQACECEVPSDLAQSI